MSEDLKIDVKVDTDESAARSKLDSLKAEYEKKTINLGVKLGQFDIGGISKSIARLTSDLNALSNIEFSGLDKLGASLKKINKLMSQQDGVGDTNTNNSNNKIKRLVDDQEQALNQVKELESISRDIQDVMSQINKNNKDSLKDFNYTNKNLFDDINKLSNSSTNAAFKRILKYQQEMEDLKREFSTLGVQTSKAETAIDLGSGKKGTRSWNEGYQDIIGQTAERFEKSVKRAREISSRISKLKQNIDNNINKISEAELDTLNKIEQLKKNIKPPKLDNTSNLNYISVLLESYMDFDDIKDLDFKFEDDIFEGLERFLKYVDDIKDEYNETFSTNDGDIKFDLVNNIQDSVNRLDGTIESINLGNLKKKLTEAFDIDDNIISNIEKVEGALKQLNSMSELAYDSLFNPNKTIPIDKDLDNKIKEYLSLDKKLNDTYVKLSKAELTGSNEIAIAIEKEISLLKEKKSLVASNINQKNISDDIKEQIKLQEQLNDAIANTQKVEFKSSFMDKLHKYALELNEEFDELNKKQQDIADFELPDISKTDNLKSYVDYLDSAEDGIKRIITQYTDLKGVDLTTTIYGDGTQVRKVVGNVEKATNELATAYKQADNELTRLLKTQQQMDYKGDSATSKALEEQISKWRDIKSNIADVAKQTNVYDQMIEKANNALLKNKNALTTNSSKIEFTIETNNEKAIQKFEEFKTKALSNIQEIERKYKNTDLFENAKQEADKLRNKLEEVEDSLRGVDNIDLSNLQSGMRSFNQELTQTKRDLNDLNKSTKGGFFSNFGEEFSSNLISFTAGELLADGIREVGQSLKTLVMEYDTAMANLKKVANPADIMDVSQLDAIQEKAVSIAKNVGMASQDVIQAISDTIQMGGYGMEEATKIAEQTMMLANVAEITQEAASQGVITMMSAFKLDPLKEVSVVVDGVTKSTDQLTDSMDKLNYVGNNFSISSGGILDAITSGANVLSEYGVSMNDTIAMITGANTTLQNPQKVGNGLKTIAINLAGIKANAKDGTLELNKTAKTLTEVAGIDIFEDKKTGQIKDMAQVMEELASKWDKFTEKERAGISEAIAGKEQATVFQSLMTNFETVKQVQDELNQGWHFGSALAENSQYVDSLSGKLNKLKETWVGIFNTIFDSNSAKGLLDGLINISEAIANIVEDLDDMGILVPTLVGGFSGIFSAFKGSNSIAKMFEGVNKELSLTDKGLSLLSGGISKTTGFLKNFLIQGALIAGVTVLVVALAKAWDECTNGLKNAERDIKNSIEGINNSINQDTQNLKVLEDTEKRYEELIKKKEEYSNIPLEDMTEEQLADMRELEQITSDLAKMFPELVIGYDEDGRPIMLMADDMDKLKEKTKEQIELNRELLKIKREELANVAREQVQIGEKFGMGIGAELDFTNHESNAAYDSLIFNEEQYTKAVQDGNKWRTKSYEKAIAKNKKDLEEHYNKGLQLYQEYTTKELEIQQSAFDKIQERKGYDGLDKNKASEVQVFMDNLNWANMDETQYNAWINGFDKVIKLAGEGSPKVKEWSDALELANDKYAATENVDEYNKSLEKLAKSISEDLNIDYDTVFSGLENMVKPLSEAEKAMNNFLESFGSSRFELLNGDKFANQLAEQFNGIENVIDKMFSSKEYAFKANGALTFNMMTEIANKDEIPDQIQKLANELAKGGVTKAESDIMLEILMSIKSGDKEKIEKTIEDVNKQLEELGMKDNVIDIKTLFDETGTNKAKSDINEIMNGDKTATKEILINTHGEEKAKQMLEAIDLLDSRPDVKKAVSAVVDGEDDLVFFYEIIKNLPVNEEYTNKFIVENTDALSQMKTYQEVIDYINGQPKEWKATYGFNSDGVDETKEKIDSVNKAIEEGNGKEFTVKTNNENVLDTIEDIETLIKMSSEVEDGKYKLDIEANTEQAVNNLKNLETGLDSLSTKLSGMPVGNITIHTAQSAKNISGLMARIDQYKESMAGIKNLTFNSNTAQSAKNISGLINRVNQYKDTASTIKTLVFKSETAQSAKNISGLMRKVDSYNTSTKPKTLTFKTNANTITSQINTLSKAIRNVPNGKTIKYNITTSGSVPKATPRVIENPSYDINTAGLSENDETSLANTINNPNARGYSKPLDTFTYGLNHFVELESRLSKIASQLDIIDEKAKNAFGQEKINYLKQQENLLKQQQQLQADLSSEMQKQQQALKSFLSGKGIKFDSDGNISNYHTKLVAMNKELERLEEVSKKASEASSNYKGDNDGERDRLSNISKQASDNLSKYKDTYDELKKAMDEYLSLTFTDIPKASEEWQSLQNEIIDTSNAIEELNRNQKLFSHQNKIKELEYEYDKLADKIDIINKKLDNSYGAYKLNLIKDQISLLKEQQKIQDQIVNSLNNQVNIYKNDLSSYGFKFDANNDITNIDETLEKFKNHKDLEKVKSLLEEYIDLQRDELPDAVKEWESLNSAIKDAYKEQLNITKDIEDKITDIYKKQIEERKKLIDEDLNNKLNALNKEKEAYNELRKEQDYEDEYNEQLGVIEELQRKVDIASKDGSLSGQKKLQDLLNQLSEEQKKLQDMVQDKIDSDINDMFDKESERLEEEAEKQKDNLDKKFSDDHIRDLVKTALSTGVFEDIDGTMRSLQDVMLGFVDEYGDGLSSIGELIKNEMIANLNIAKNTMKDITNILKELDLNQYSNIIGRMVQPDISRNLRYAESSNYSNSTVQFNSPLMVVEGDITEDVLPTVKNMISKVKDDITKQIVNYIK